ncbi:uncharacterized protein BCR38DRAFT_442987 [Pseudomassariella vexata]|uniref:DUF1772-domain-containing protein n=1 Tax=Pseudomassariella vexata TaxID=1141098 RepID=A0A1Y2DNV4_9PEZI|nr:uncharacterized protein BCR38DRAFT_442987 [Pseudomassariella vexata]ORY60952.1 hypothetical protein BCR38DRAFT_442987 [Pseudomassariella vexata]
MPLPLTMTTSDVLRFISILASAIHTGSQFSLSFVSGAALLASPTADEATVLAQFRVIFRRGFVLCPPFAAIATLANLGNAFISWRSNDDGASMALRFLLAGLCTASLIPFTLLFVVCSEGLLLEKAAERLGEGKRKTPSSAARTRDLIKEWARLNYLRTLFPLIGALVSYSARYETINKCRN